MNIYLGNLSTQEIQLRSGVKFPAELVQYMETRQQQEAANVAVGKWHCFDIPFFLVCGDMETAQEIYQHLGPLSEQFESPLEIGIQKAQP